MKNKRIGKKQFLVTVNKRIFDFKEGDWADGFYGDDTGKLIKKYKNGNVDVLSNKAVYGESLEDVKRKVNAFVNDDMKESSLVLIKERAKVEVEKFKEHSLNRIRDINKEIEDLKVNRIGTLLFAIEQQISLLKKEDEDLRLELKELDKWDGTSKKEKSLYENLSMIIRDDNIEDYTIVYRNLEYIILESNCIVDLTLQVNDHLVCGWKTLGGIQIGVAGGGEYSGSWKDTICVQSLMCGS
jgi:hypothetical protein